MKTTTMTAELVKSIDREIRWGKRGLGYSTALALGAAPSWAVVL